MLNNSLIIAKYTYEYTYFSIILSGLGFRPMPPEVNVESTLVWYESSKPDNYKYWVDETTKFLEGKYASSVLANFCWQSPKIEDFVCLFFHLWEMILYFNLIMYIFLF